MGSNSFGKIFTITTWGESHSKAIGVVIDGCPSNLEISEEEINRELSLRSPGKGEFTSQRKEDDKAKIVSGVFEGKTTGSPISIIIENKDQKSKDYEKIKDVLRPSHSNFTYLNKYGHIDYRGGARASGRETALRVVAGAVAKKLLQKENITVYSYVKSIGDIEAKINHDDLDAIYESKVFCPCKETSQLMIKELTKVQEEKDSIGGVVEFQIHNLPIGLGEPIYDKLSSKLAHALMTIPGTKGFEIGDGFLSTKKRGLQRNDSFALKNNFIKPKTNNEGGVLAGISTGETVIGKVAFKPTASIQYPQETLDIDGNKTSISFNNRHDVCIAIRATPAVQSMIYLVLADLYLFNKLSKLS